MNKLYIISLFFLIQCSHAQPVIEISPDFHLKQVGQELLSFEENSAYGRRVVMNENGKTLLVTDRAKEKAYVYQLVRGKWVQVGQTLENPSTSWFGFEADMSDDGRTIAIGSESQGIHVYHYINDQWQAKGKKLTYEKYSFGTGRRVELSGDGNLIAFSAYSAETPTGVVDAGAVYVLEFIDQKWVPKGKPIYGTLAGHQMGYGMSFSRDGKRLVISSPYARYQFTQAYHFKNGDWRQLGDDINKQEKKDGWHIRLSDEGNKILAFNGDARCYLHEFQNGNWVNIQLPSSAKNIQGLGYSMEFINNSNVFILGNPDQENANNIYGGIYFYELDDKNKSKQIGVLNNENSGNYLAYSIDASTDGNFMAVGSYSMLDQAKGKVVIYEIVRN